MRPPYGECLLECESALSKLGYVVVGWNFDTFDWQHNTTQTVFKSVEIVVEAAIKLQSSQSKTDAGPIVLMHSNQNTSIDTVVPVVLELFSKAAYRFVSVEKCLGVMG